MNGFGFYKRGWCFWWLVCEGLVSAGSLERNPFGLFHETSVQRALPWPGILFSLSLQRRKYSGEDEGRGEKLVLPALPAEFHFSHCPRTSMFLRNSTKTFLRETSWLGLFLCKWMLPGEKKRKALMKGRRVSQPPLMHFWFCSAKPLLFTRLQPSVCHPEEN